MRLKIIFHEPDFIAISSKVAERLGVESNEMLLLTESEQNIQVISAGVDDEMVHDLALPKWYLNHVINDEREVGVSKLALTEFAIDIEVTINTIDHEGVDLSIVRKSIQEIGYFVHGQIIHVQPDERNLQIKITGPRPGVYTITKQTRIRFRGKHVPSIISVGGQKELIDWYNNTYLFSLKAMDYMSAWSIPTPSGLLLSGEPGLGKTHFLKAMVADAGVFHISIFAPNIITPLAGDGDMVIMKTFELARNNAPTIISIDEIDALCLSRSGKNQTYENRVVTVLLQEMDGIRSRGNVFVIGTTNRPEAIDKAFLRPGRLTTHIKLKKPNIHDRISILDIYLQKANHSLESEDIKDIAQLMDGFTGAQIANSVYESAIKAIKSHLDNQEDLVITKEIIASILSS